MTYTLTSEPTTILRDRDGAFIPFDPGNVDYQAYRAWLAEGNTPTPYTPPPADLAGVIADSALSLAIANAKSLAEQGRTDGAIAALLNLMET